MRLLIGLGNPGPEYAGTRHNVGFEVLERLALHEGLLFQSPRSLEGFDARGERAKFRVARSFAPDVLLVQPLAYMNRSGEVLPALLRWCNQELGRPHGEGPVRSAGAPSGDRPVQDPADLDGFPLEDILVVYDDLDLPLGQLRLRPHGGHGGHNGIRSLIDCLGSRRFTRLRIGIGQASTDAARHVLGAFEPAERVEVDISVAEASEAAWAFCGGEPFEKLMTRFHSRWSQET